jgi:hypothetical protein
MTYLLLKSKPEKLFAITNKYVKVFRLITLKSSRGKQELDSSVNNEMRMKTYTTASSYILSDLLRTRTRGELNYMTWKDCRINTNFQFPIFRVRLCCFSSIIFS